MADEVKVKMHQGAVQNTGNVVLDSTVNLLMNYQYFWDVATIPALYEAVLDIYEREQERKGTGGPRKSLAELAERAKR
jgi:hypothetical protein